jgi:phage terminase small subunit
MSTSRTEIAADLPGPLIPDDEVICTQAFKDGPRPQAREGSGDRFNAARKKIFLETLRRTANITRSANAAGISPNTAYRHRARNPEFDLAWLEALTHAIDVLETVMIERALRFNASVSESGLDEEQPAAPVEPFSNGDAMRLIKLHRDGIAQRREAIAARLHARPEATRERFAEQLRAIHERLMARGKVRDDAPA